MILCSYLVLYLFSPFLVKVLMMFVGSDDDDDDDVCVCVCTCECTQCDIKNFQGV